MYSRLAGSPEPSPRSRRRWSVMVVSVMAGVFLFPLLLLSLSGQMPMIPLNIDRGSATADNLSLIRTDDEAAFVHVATLMLAEDDYCANSTKISWLLCEMQEHQQGARKRLYDFGAKLCQNEYDKLKKAQDKETYGNYTTKKDKYKLPTKARWVESCEAVVHVLVKQRWGYYWSGFGIIVFLIILFFSFCWLGTHMAPHRPTYWTYEGTPMRYFTCCRRFYDDFYREVDVTSQLKASVQDLFDQATVSERMGKGYDGSWVSHGRADKQPDYDAFEVVSVKRIENGRLWSQYARNLKSTRTIDAARAEMENTHTRPSGSGNSPDNERSVLLDKFNSIVKKAHDQIFGSERWKRTPRANVKTFVDSLELETDKNEVLLFHGLHDKGARNPFIKEGPLYDRQMYTERPKDGTPDDEEHREENRSPLQCVVKQGFDDRMAKIEGMIGAGLYFADMVSKADCYAGKYKPLAESEEGAEAVMLLCRVTLGVPCWTDIALESLRRPPCYHGHFDPGMERVTLPQNTSDITYTPWAKKGVRFALCDHHRFDSIICDRKMKPKGKLYCEYAIFGKGAYPEFVVRYKRVMRNKAQGMQVAESKPAEPTSEPFT